MLCKQIREYPLLSSVLALAIARLINRLVDVASSRYFGTPHPEHLSDKPREGKDDKGHDPPGHVILCHVKGRMKRFNIRILQGDQVSIEMSPYDLTKGRIVYRNR